MTRCSGLRIHNALHLYRAGHDQALGIDHALWVRSQQRQAGGPRGPQHLAHLRDAPPGQLTRSVLAVPLGFSVPGSETARGLAADQLQSLAIFGLREVTVSVQPQQRSTVHVHVPRPHSPDIL